MSIVIEDRFKMLFYLFLSAGRVDDSSAVQVPETAAQRTLHGAYFQTCLEILVFKFTSIFKNITTV